jgi:hypothetical protein
MSIIREFARFIEPTGELEYDNTTSGLSATTIKSAIDELNTLLGGGNVGSQATFSIYEFAASGGQTIFDLSGTFTTGGDVTAGNFITNETYKIQTTGDTDFTLIGAADSNPGTVFTATGPGTGTGTARVAVTYIPGYIQVYVNGVFIASTDYTASSGQTVILTEAAEASDLVTVVVLDSFNTATQLRVINVDASAPDDSLVVDNVGDVNVTSDIKLADNGKVIFGASSDLEIYHDGSNSYIQNSSGNLILKNSTADYFRGVLSTGAAELYYSGDSKLTTTSTGIDVTGTVSADGLTVDSGSTNTQLTLARSTTHSGISFSTQISDFGGGGADLIFDGSGNSTGFGFRPTNSSGTLQTGLVISPDGSVGIGTSSPDESLVVEGGVKIRGTNYLSFTNTSDQTYIRAPSSNVLAFGTDSTERLRIDSVGNIGQGVVPSASHYKSLEIGASGSGITGRGAADTYFLSGLFWDGASTYEYSVSSVPVGTYQITNGIHSWATAPAGTAGTAATPQTNMTLDTSGNLLVGKTANDNTSNGFVLDANGTLNIVRSSEYLMRLNRTSTDGEIARFQKDGTTVGSIGTLSSNMYVGSSDTSLFFDSLRDALVPHNASTNAARSSAIDLGRDVVPFKDLYLSGAIHQSFDVPRVLGPTVEFSGGLADIADTASRTITLSGLGNFQGAMLEVWVNYRATGGTTAASARKVVQFFENNDSVIDITEMEFSGRSIVTGDIVVTDATNAITITITNTDWFGSNLTGTTGGYYLKILNCATADSTISKT